MPELEMAEVSLEELALEHAELLPARETLQALVNVGPIAAAVPVNVGANVGVQALTSNSHLMQVIAPVEQTATAIAPQISHG